MSITVTAIEKQGPIIVCSTDDPKNRVYKLNFQEGKIYGIAGKPLQSTSSIINKIPNAVSTNNIFFAALYAFKNSGYCQNVSLYPIVESLLSYPDLIPPQINMDMVRYIQYKLDGKLPKGYVAWCRKNNKKFLSETLKEFIIEQKFGQWPQSLVESVKKFSEGSGFDLAEATYFDKELCASLLHIINNSLKRYEISNLLQYLQYIISLLQENPRFRPYLDDTKNAKAAYQILKNALDNERNEKILANETRIAALDGTLVDDIVIKVPSTMDDFTKEGEQQHNCVGYFYHKAMAEGDTLIYFLRHIKNPRKSYVTCRYRTDDKRTVEYRIKNNDWFEDKTGLIKRIDRMINNILGV